jgi:hypothetical protein
LAVTSELLPTNAESPLGDHETGCRAHNARSCAL